MNNKIEWSGVGEKNMAYCILSLVAAVRNLWLFWWRHLGRFIFYWHDCYEWNFFCNFQSSRLQSHQQHHAAPEVALTVRSMLLWREISDIYHCLKRLIFLKMHTLVGKLVALSVEKFCTALTEIQLKIFTAGFMAPLAKKVPDPWLVAYCVTTLWCFCPVIVMQFCGGW